MNTGINATVMNRESAPAAGRLVVLALLITATAENWGTFSWPALTLTLAALALCFWLHVRPDPFRRVAAEPLLLGLLIACAGVTMILQQGQDQDRVVLTFGTLVSRQLTWPGIAAKVASGFALGLTLLLLRPRGRRNWIPAALVLTALLARVFILLSSPFPKIDVFIVQSVGAHGVLRYSAATPDLDARPELRNPYTMEFFSPYESEEISSQYAYSPLTLYANAVSWMLFKDVRGLWIVCDMAGALFIYLLGRGGRRKEAGELDGGTLAALVWLFLPRSLFVIQQSWTEPLCVAMLGLAAVVRGRWGRGAALGLWLASKQYLLAAVPLAARLRRFGLRELGIAAGVGFLTLTPFLIWDWRAMYADLLGFFFTSAVRPDALSVVGAFERLGIHLSWPAVVALWAGGVAFFAWRMKRTRAGWLFGTGSFYLYFFLLGKQAFMNYYYLIMFAILLSVAADDTEPQETGVTS